jgi:hypothetical protein
VTGETATSKVFISYSHKDVAWKDRVLEQLRVLELAGELIVWDDERIEDGDEWLLDIETAMNAAEVAVLLISADFLTSPFIRRSEIPRLLGRRQTEGLRVIPIFVRPCAWSAVGWLAELQGRPRDGRSLSELRRHQAEKQLAALALEIGELLGKRAPSRPVPEPQTEVPPQPTADARVLTLSSPDPRSDGGPLLPVLPEPAFSDDVTRSRETDLEFPREARTNSWIALACSLLGWLFFAETPSGFLSINYYYLIISLTLSIISFKLALSAIRMLNRLSKAKRGIGTKFLAVSTVVLASTLAIIGVAVLVLFLKY